MTAIPIRSFRDQDRDRAVVEQIARREVVDLLMQMDLVTTDGAGLAEHEKRVPPEEVESYAKFRQWIGPRFQQAIVVAIGQALQASAVDGAGHVSLDESRLRVAITIDERVGLGARLDWIGAELRSLTDAYGELYDEETVEALALSEEIDGLDIGTDAGWDRARAIWSRAEELYKWAQPGSRITRQDPDAIADARATLGRWQAQIEREEQERMKRLAVVGGRDADSGAQLKDAIREVEDQIEALLAESKALRRRHQENRRATDALSQRLTDLLAAAGAAGIDVG